VQPDYGTLADFEKLVAECKKRGISVILDMTCNHSSTYTKWFQESRNPQSTYRSWYRWAVDGDTRYNLNQKIWGHNVWNKTANGDYYSAIFDSGMPDFNLDEPAVRAEMKKIMKFWMDKGVSGFRYDAAGHVYNAAKIPTGENSLEKGVAFWKELIDYDRSVNPDAFTVGEVWEPTSTRAAYIASLYSDFHFDMGTKIIDAINAGDDGKNNVANSLYGDYNRYKEANSEYVDAPFLSNHDQNRSAGLLRLDSSKIKLAAGMYILAEGVPFIYYGEEIGMNGGTNDPARRSPFLWNAPGKDKMQCTWEDSLVKTYNRKAIPEAKQRTDENSILSYYRRLIRVKTEHPALYKGRMKPSFTGTSCISSWFMECPEEKAFVVHNLSNESVTVSLPSECEGMELVFAPNGTMVSKGQLTITPLASVVLSK
jgi:glycosidase